MAEPADLHLDRFEGLLVDLDGTLVDSAGPVHRAWTAFAHRRGLDPAEVIGFAQGRPSPDTVRALIGDGDLAREEERLVEESEVNDTGGTSAFPGALELLQSGRMLAIVTSCSTELARVRLAAAGLPRPEIVVTCDDVERGKPDPQCFLLGARLLGVPIERCAVLEDSPAGVAAGRAAGAHVIAVRTTHGEAELAAADTVVDSLAVLTAG